MLVDAIKIAGFSLALAVATSSSASSQAAGKTEADDARTGIELTLNKVAEMVAKGAPVNEVAHALYEDDVMITGEGEKALYPNLSSFKARLEYFLQDAAGCSLNIVDPIRHSGNLAVAFVREHCKAADAGGTASDARVLYVFRKGSKGWRVTMEMFGSGAM
jgi:hypothetical protein